MKKKMCLFSAIGRSPPRGLFVDSDFTADLSVTAVELLRDVRVVVVELCVGSSKHHHQK